MPRRLLVLVRFVVLGSVTLGAVAVADHWLSWLTLAGTLGPTSYTLIAHPSSAAARLRSALAGHSLAVAVGLGAVAAWGGWGHAFVGSHRPSVGQAVATALAAALLLALLEILDLHHAPAAATVILVASSLVPVGPPLAGLVIALAAVIVLSAALARAWPAPPGTERAP
ncbi:MAG TPA: HPP family protein [Solirubrobacteraceae bacterium]|nr:HPP family protein [Solirubrobacteraceae bacterium]